MKYGEMKFRVNGEEVTYNECKSMKKPKESQGISVIDMIDDKVDNAMEVDFISEALVGVLFNDKSEDIEEYNKVGASLIGFGSYTNNLYKLDLDLKNQESPLSKTSIEGPPQLELKPLPPHLCYEFWGKR